MTELSLKQRLVNYYYFAIFISILACIIAIGYWFETDGYLKFPFSQLTSLVDILYIATTHFSIVTLIVFANSLVILPTIYLKPKPATIIQTILFFLLLTILVFDVRVFQFSKNQAHIFSIEFKHLINILSYKEAIFSIDKLIFCCGIILLLLVIHKMQQWINNSNYLTNNNIGTVFSLLVLTSIIISVLSYQLATKVKQQQLLTYVQYLPLSNKNILIKNIFKMIKNNQLQYPIKPLEITSVTNPPNILIIAMDAWRADCFNADDSPNLWQFSQQGKIFTNHFSGGNHTFVGLFSLFYGIPANYFNKFQQKKTPALLFSRLKQLDYQINCFSSNDNYQLLELYTNINSLNKLNTNITRPYQKDQVLTSDWIDWYQGLNKTKPWFSFVFYDSLHGLDFPDNYSKAAKPSANLYGYNKFFKKYGKDNFIVSYKTSIHYIDILANKILQQLKNNNDLENTIVIITADHGCEWDDNNQGKYGYGNNFTNCQVQVPLAIIYPKNDSFNKQSIETKLTSHYDIAPTLMHNYLGTNNNITDYSIGNDLISNFNSPEQILIASATDRYVIDIYFAILAKNKTIQINLNSSYNLLDKFNNVIVKEKLSQDYLNSILDNITKFIKK